MKKVSLYFAVALIALSETGIAAEKKIDQLLAPPSFFENGTNADSSVLTMDCEGVKPFDQLECKFIQTRISKKDTEEVEKEIEALKTDIKKMTDDELSKQIERLCENLENGKKKATTISTLPQEKKAYLNLVQQDWTPTCDCKKPGVFVSKRDCLIKAMEPILSREKETCHITVNTFELNFKRHGSRKWISNPGPKGICGLVNVATIEHKAETSLLWSYTQTRVAGNTDSENCRKYDLNKPITYSWDATSESLMNCSIIKFGLF